MNQKCYGWEIEAGVSGDVLSCGGEAMSGYFPSVGLLMKGKIKVMKSIKYTYHGNLLYTHFKKHFCPRCGTGVKLGRERKLVNSRSPESKNYNFSMCGDYLIGDVEFRIRCFYCPNCQINISFEEMEKYEERKKK